MEGCQRCFLHPTENWKKPKLLFDVHKKEKSAPFPTGISMWFDSPTRILTGKVEVESTDHCILFCYFSTFLFGIMFVKIEVKGADGALLCYFSTFLVRILVEKKRTSEFPLDLYIFSKPYRYIIIAAIPLTAFCTFPIFIPNVMT